MTKRFINIALFLLLSSAAAMAQTQPRWIRHSSISPDGQTIAFAYQGDIFTVPTAGGTARQITTNAAFDSDPIWSADGSRIVFKSMRELSEDIWVVPAQGGSPTRLTTFSGKETPLATSPDGYVYFIANIQPDPAYDGFPGDNQLYRVSLAGGRISRVTSLPVCNVSVNANGDIIYEDYKGYEDDLRKHHTSAVTRDIWLMRNGEFTKLTGFDGEDRNPVWAADGSSFYYLSEASGSFNVWRGSSSASGDKQQLTNFTTHPVRGLSVSADGTLLFSWNGDLYTCAEGREPRMVNIALYLDDRDREVIRKSVMSGITGICASPDGKEVAVVSHGDIYVTAADVKSTRRITDSAEQERGVCFGEDGTIFYASERNGHWGIYKATIEDKGGKYFSLSYNFKEELFTPAGQTCTQPSVSPDGKWLAFIRNRSEIVIMPTKGGDGKVLIKDFCYSYHDGDQEYSWCPDSKHILCSFGKEARYTHRDIAMIDIDDLSVTDLTRSGYYDGNFRWALGGKAMTWETDKDGFRSHGGSGAEGDIYLMFFDAEAYGKFKREPIEDDIEKMLKSDKDKKKDEKKEEKDSVKAAKGKIEKIAMDLENRDLRTIRLTRISGRLGDHYLTPDGDKLYYEMRLESGMDLCCLDIKKGSVKVVEKGCKAGFVPSKDGKYLYTSGLLGVRKIDVATGKGSYISFSSEYDYRPAAEREYIFEHCWKQVQEKFYDVALHGTDWQGMHDNYVQFLPYINNNYDFRELLSEMLGELNGSHTGARYRPKASVATGRIGVLWDLDWDDASLKIAEVLPGSQLAIALPEIKAGDEILAVDGKPVEKGQAWYDVFFGKYSRRVMLTVKCGGKTKEVPVVTTQSDNDLLYSRWVLQREKMVEKLSGGRVGYVHVKSMDTESFRVVYSKALGRYLNCDALIVDERHNGGGHLHEDLVTFLNGHKYMDRMPRGQVVGWDPKDKWTKPSCVLTCEDCYSNACGFPYTYKTMGIGKLIGSPVPGTMTSVWWETQVDNTLIFGIPEIAYWTVNEDRPIENMQVEPDILIYNDPASVLNGKDPQLEAAVREMLK